jgi:DNA polymerase-3 subunit alpha
MAEIEGEGNVLPVCTYSTLSNRAAFRLAAEAAGVPKERIDQLAKIIPDMIDSGMVESDDQAYEQLRDELGIDIYQDASHLFDSIGGVSQHACAYAIGTEKRPLQDWVPSYRIGSSNAVVTQYNMKWIEELGFLKLDLLKLDSLSIMHQVARLIGKDMRFLDEICRSVPGIYDDADAKTWKLLQAGRTAGVHTFQGNSQRRGLIEVVPKSDHDLAAVQALYRPSGTRSDLDKRFVARRHEREDWQPLNELTAKFTNDTYGVTIYQEQIMEMGAEMGMSGEEIDDLYKAIKTAKGVGRGARELFDRFEPTFRKYAKRLMPKREADELWADWHRLQGYTFNRGHATSYAILGLKMAHLKAHFPQEFFIALLDRYPTNTRYLAAAIEEGFKFERPDVNKSAGGFTRGADKRGIRVGLLRVRGLGPGAVGEIVRNQPFGSLDDLRSRTDARRVDKTVVEALGRLGALESLGIRGDRSDATEFELLDFTLDRPRALRGCRPSVRARGHGTWRFRGLERGVKITEGKSFVAKMFWLPDVDDNFSTKTSATGRYNAHLLTALDENGVPFDITVGEEKEIESKLIKLLAKKARGSVVTLNGKVNVPFRRGGNTSFSLWGVEGAEDGNPQCWGIDEELAKMIIHLAREKRYARGRA